jgi:hypothetical protein
VEGHQRLEDDMGKPTVEQVRILAAQHLARYGAMWERAKAMQRRLGHSDGYRLEEIAELLDIWRSVEAAGWRWDELDARARAEVYDAMEDEDWLERTP